jgi:hypothetical protein
MLVFKERSAVSILIIYMYVVLQNAWQREAKVTAKITPRGVATATVTSYSYIH